MKNNLRFLLLPLLCIYTTHLHAAELSGFSFFTPRSQGTDAARDIIGNHRFMHQWDECDWYGTGAATVEYTRSFKPHRIAGYFFGASCFPVEGSQVENRCDVAVLADYFGLSPAFDSEVCFRPLMQNVIVDLEWCAGYHNWYFYTSVPIVWTNSTMGLNELVEDDGSAVPFPDGYMGEGVVKPPYKSFACAMLGTHSFGDVQPLKFGKIACKNCGIAGVANIQACVGYDLVLTEDGHAGFNFRVALPTGNRPTSEFLFTPVIGNGKHWEAGVGFSGSIKIWEKDGDQRTDFFFDANVMHLFNSWQQRSFDFRRNGFGSRYILLKQFDENRDYTGVTLPAINLTTLPCLVEIAAQIDLVIMFGYQNKGFNFDIGYNGWVRSREEICLKADPFAHNNYGFKGIQNIINIDTSTNSTQSTATIYGDPFDLQALVVDPNSPVFIGAGNLDIQSGGSPLQVTQAIFWNSSYAWHTEDEDRLSPFFGCGGKIEFEGIVPKNALANKNSLSQWSLWIKTGYGW